MAKCIICETELSGDSASREHIIPEKPGRAPNVQDGVVPKVQQRDGYPMGREAHRGAEPVLPVGFPQDEPSEGNSRRRVLDAQGNAVVMRGGVPHGTDRPQIVEDDGEQLVIAHNGKRARQEVERLRRTGELPPNATLEPRPRGAAATRR